MAQTRSTGSKTTKKKTAAAGGTRKKAPAKRNVSSASATRSTSSAPRKNTAPAKQSVGETENKSTGVSEETLRKLELARTQNNQLTSLILFSLGVLVFLFAVIPGAKAWGSMHKVLLGSFGISVFLVPAILIYTALLVGQDRTKQATGRAFAGMLLTVACSGFIQVFFGKTVWSDGFKMTIENLYAEGQAFHGGGLLSGVIAWPLIALFDVIGAKIFIIMAIFVFVMLLTNKSVVDLLTLISKPFVGLWHGIENVATKGVYFYEDDDHEQDDVFDISDDEMFFEDNDDDDIDTDDEDELRFFADLPRRPRLFTRREKQPEIIADGNQLELMSDVFENIDVDVPIHDTDPNLSREETNPLTADNHPEESFSARMSAEEEEELSRMIANAEGHHTASSPAEDNRLPWADDDEADTDESVYAEPEAVPYIAPPLTLLNYVDNTSNNAEKSAELREKSQLLKDTLASFGVEVRIVGMRRGPSVTRYEIQPAAGVKISKITALADDIGMNLGGEKVRIEAPIPGKPAVGVEVANNTKDIVPIRDILESAEFQESKSKLTFAVGKDIDGNIILGDIAKMPHMIIAGTTGSGKSVCTNSIIMSVLFHASPEEVRMVLIDPKVVEFAPYDGIPHLLIPVVTNPQKAAGALNWAVIEMERRYSIFAEYSVRDLKGYNALAERNEELKKLPQILIIIDEFADLMMSAAKEVETSVIRLAQKARAAGLHLIIATQRPTVDVITGLIKANVPSRIGMSVKSSQDSRIILDCTGAETLLGNGDLLFYPNGWREPKRVQGCFCSDGEVEAVTSFLKSNGTSEYDMDIIEAVDANIPMSKGEKPMGTDEPSEVSGDEELIIRAAEYAVDAGQLSTTALQRRLKLGYARAARIVDELEERGIIGPSEGAKPRRVMMTPQELTEWKLRIASKGGKFEE